MNACCKKWRDAKSLDQPVVVNNVSIDKSFEFCPECGLTFGTVGRDYKEFIETYLVEMEGQTFQPDSPLKDHKESVKVILNHTRSMMGMPEKNYSLIVG